MKITYLLGAASLTVGAVSSCTTILGIDKDYYEDDIPEPPPPTACTPRKVQCGGGPCVDPSAYIILYGVVRDFKMTHEDFENAPLRLGRDEGIVKPELGEGRNPVYAGEPNTPTTTGEKNFNQWFQDVKWINKRSPLELTLSLTEDGWYTYHNPEFFPLDNEIDDENTWGKDKEEWQHNYNFTLELHTEFEYKGGEVLKVTGDDDLFVFINDKLVIDLGGTHGAEPGEVDLDDIGMTVGKTYPLDLFFAERQSPDSHLGIKTTITCFKPQ